MAERVTRTAQKSTPAEDFLTTRQVAALLGIAPASVTRLQVDGLAGCVVTWGGDGRGQETLYDALRASWFLHARECARRCRRCRGVLAGLVVVGEHFRRHRHGCRESCDDRCIDLSPRCEGGTCDEEG